jgi:hypothetical protein
MILNGGGLAGYAHFLFCVHSRLVHWAAPY